MAAQNDDQRPNDNLDRYAVEADDDPKVVGIARNESEASAETEFAEAEADFARHEFEVSTDLSQEGRTGDAQALRHNATLHMKDASSVMGQAHVHEHEAERLRNEKRQELSRELREWTGQSLITLGDAVRGVRAHVEQMSEHDVRKIVRASDLTEEDVTRKREIIIEYAQTIEITLNSAPEVRRDPLALVKALGAFTTLAFELARYLPSLMQKLEEFGRLLSQFHF